MTSRRSPSQQPRATAPGSSSIRDDLRARVLEQLARMRALPSRRVAPTPPPRYDGEFFEFLDWLERA